MVTNMTNSTNPLSKFFRQPILFIKLPSLGRYYKSGSIDLPVTKELPVYGMTAKDEIISKTPDALITGQATVEIIQSCIPNIKNAWEIPVIDLDHILISIRRATYGDGMDFISVCPHCQTKNENTINLEALVSQTFHPDFEETIKTNDLEIFIRPQTFFQLNTIAMKNFEYTRAAKIIEDQTLTDPEKIAKVSEILKKLIDLAIDSIQNSVVAIKTNDGILVEDPDNIREFLKNCDKEIWEIIKNKIETMGDQNPTKKIDLICLNDECKKNYITPLIFELSNFFD